jgi:hypothetical protein
MSVFPHHRWPGEQAYRYLEDVGPAGLAWEWLRRDPDYCQLAPAPRRAGPARMTLIEHAPDQVTSRWGCLNVEDPALPAPEETILWSSAIDPAVLRCVAAPAAVGQVGAFDLDLCGERSVLTIDGAGGEHLLIRGCSSGLRLDVFEGTLLGGPVTLHYDFSAVRDIVPPLDTLLALHRLCRTGRLQLPSTRKRQRDRRVLDALRTHDALQAGASIRDVGILLFGVRRVAEEWGAPGEALKSCTRRMIELARRMATGEYKSLLQPKASRKT